MEQVFTFLGFTDAVGIFWNSVAYIGMILIIAAVVSARWRNQFFFWGPLALLLYAGLYLKNPILAGLQLIIAVSGILNLFSIKKIASVVLLIALTIAVYTLLLLTRQISGLWTVIGSFGFLGIAFGMTQLPLKRAFTIMAFGGLLIIIYALALHIWVFVVLNAIFFVVNLIKVKRRREE